MKTSLHADTATSHTTNESLHLEMAARFSYDGATRIIKVEYTATNHGNEALALFDRGNANSLASRKHELGDVSIPRVSVEGEDLTLEHSIQPLPADLEITSPPTPVAMELPAGSTVKGQFELALPPSTEPKRLRWCLGVMKFADAPMLAPVQTAAGKLWSTSLKAAEKQQRICTRWYSIQSSTFVD